MTERVVPETCTDGVGRYRFGGGVVRNDVMSATEAPEGEQEAQTTSHRLILSPERFMRTVSAMNTLLNQPVNAGWSGSGGAKSPTTTGTAGLIEAGGSRSPCFP